MDTISKTVIVMKPFPSFKMICTNSISCHLKTKLHAKKQNIKIIFVNCSLCHGKLSCIVTFDIQKTAFLQNKLTEK